MMKHGTLTTGSRVLKTCLVMLVFLSACSGSERLTSAVPQETLNADLYTGTPTSQYRPTPTPTPPWPTFAPPGRESATQVPPAAKQVLLSEDVRVWVLMGTESEVPYIGRTEAFHILLFNQRLAKASLISLPGNLFVYLPGYNMQRISTAFALGGSALLTDTLAYNFGIRPDRYVLARPTSFRWLVDDLNGLEVSVLLPIRDACGGLPAGTHTMNGDRVYCYVSYLYGDDELDRVRRQQQILQLLFDKAVQNGRLAKLPNMYVSYLPDIETNIGLEDLLGYLPLALRLGDKSRVFYYMPGNAELEYWKLPDDSQTSVYLPKQKKMAEVLANAVEKIDEPSPLNEIVVTYEAQLTAAVALTQTSIPPFFTPPALTARPGITLTYAGWPTFTLTPVQTFTPTPIASYTATNTPPGSVPTADFGQTPYPIVTTPPYPP